MTIGGKLNLQDGAGTHQVSLKAQDTAYLDCNIGTKWGLDGDCLLVGWYENCGS